MPIPISVLRATSRAARQGASRHYVSPTIATRAVNDTVREGVNNNMLHSTIINSLVESQRALRTGRPPRAGTNAGVFYQDILHHMNFLDLKQQAPKAAGDFKTPRVPRNTVTTNKKKLMQYVTSKKKGSKGGMR